MLLCSLCFEAKDDASNKNFFKVPKDQRRRKQWGEICRLDFKKKVAWICEDHFQPSEIIKYASSSALSPNAVPFIPPVKEPAKIIEAAYKATNSKNGKLPTKIQNCNDVHISKAQKHVVPELTHNMPYTNNVALPKVNDNLVMEIPVRKTLFCTRSTQTNTRLCGLVETSEITHDFRINCFYCSQNFSFNRWKFFIRHLKSKHFEEEKAFEMREYMSKEHDYTPNNAPATLPAEPVIETIGISPESLLPFLGNEEEPTIPVNTSFLYDIARNMAMDAERPLNLKQEPLDIKLEPAFEHPTSLVYEQNDNKECSVNMENLDNFVAIKHTAPRKVKKSISFKSKLSKANQMRSLAKQAPRKTALSRFLKRTINEETKLNEKEDSFSSFNLAKQQSTPIISYEYSPSAIVDLLLESMRNFPALWQFTTEPFNDEFSKSVAELCLTMNAKWALNIDHLTMRRSINRILRFYCYLFPNENIENIHPFTGYYDKCAEFLPASVNEIAYARCSNCYICYKNDYDLKRHLLKEQSFNLRRPYKCVECKECFTESDEYEFHKRLPHYAEVFRCEPCKKKFFRRNKYNRHISEYHPADSEERKYKCDKCDRSYKTNGCLIAHKVFHGERKFKCHLCSKSYHENAKLQIHLKTHRKEYDYICEVCAKEFVTQSALTAHMKTHTGEKVDCPMCDLKLRKSSLSRHLRLLHSPGDGNVSQSVKLRSKGKIKSYKTLIRIESKKRKKCLQKNYRCKICMINFERFKSLMEHNKEMHSDLPKWPCQLCTTAFRTKVNLKRHYRKKHELHVIQTYKLVEEGEDIGDVLAIKKEQLDILAENGVCSTISTTQASNVKSELLSDENSIEENMEVFEMLEDTDTDNITKGEIKLSYINEFFADI